MTWPAEARTDRDVHVVHMYGYAVRFTIWTEDDILSAHLLLHVQVQQKSINRHELLYTSVAPLRPDKGRITVSHKKKHSTSRRPSHTRIIQVSSSSSSSSPWLGLVAGDILIKNIHYCLFILQPFSEYFFPVNAANFGSFFGSSFASFSGAYKIDGQNVSTIQHSIPSQEAKGNHHWISWILVTRCLRMLRYTNLISSTSTRTEDKLSCGLTRRTTLWWAGCWGLHTIGCISLSLCRGWGQRIFTLRRLPIQTPSWTDEGDEFRFFSWSFCRKKKLKNWRTSVS